MARVLVFGEVLWDVLPTGSVLGGAPANFATRVQYLGVPVVLASRVGCDPLGEEALATLSRLGLDVSSVQHDPTLPTGTVEVVVDDAGSATYNILPGVAYDAIAATPDLLAAAARAEVLYFGTLCQRNATARATLLALMEAAPQATKLLDVNLRRDCFTRETVEESLRRADILKLNETEVVDIAGLLNLGVTEMEAFAEAVITRYDLQLCLVTRGALGVFARGKDGQRHYVPGYDVKVVDTIGAGDAFTAGFVWSQLNGGSLSESCEVGTRLGALVATQRGGMEPITVEQLNSAPLEARRSEG
ncbi:MAG TPA: carbohydrate kinase [Myxococcota bacterium]|nr:carbohydrate kinase [Myxococcota bacterium]